MNARPDWVKDESGARFSRKYCAPALRITGCFLLAGVLLTGCVSPVQEPPNLSPLKQRIRAYVDSGQYQRDLEGVATRAKSWIETRHRQGGAKLTVVFDLDETLLLNWPHISAMDFGYVVPEWEKWVDAAGAPAIEPVREVYRTARRLGIEVVYITGRTERGRAGTLRNLQGIECADHAVLICKPDHFKGTAASFKTEARRKLVAEGRTIIANIGDQMSDLVGGFSERTFKLPNAFYIAE
jgi:predicted secreted acid phosphatase